MIKIFQLILNKSFYSTFVLLFFLGLIFTETTYASDFNTTNLDTNANAAKSSENIILIDDYINVEYVLDHCEYLTKDLDNENFYRFIEEEITIYFDYKNQVITKNEFTFYLKGKMKFIQDKYYIEKKLLESLINKKIEVTDNKIIFKSFYDIKDYWITNYNLVAHACGQANGLAVTNSKEALTTSYNNGLRVFEIDLNLTSDHELVAVHDWESYKGIKTKEQYMNSKIATVFTPLSIEDILRTMVVNKDFYLITDTKSFSYSDALVKKQFQILVDKAKLIDPNLLKRIIPQIYNEKTYKLVKEVYNFDNIIYTLYQTNHSDKQVLEFVKTKDDIKIITMAPTRFSQKFTNDLAKINKYVYLFTINKKEDIKNYLSKGVDGFYTDFIYPHMLDE